MFGLSPLPPHFHAAVRDVDAKRPEARMAAAERLGRAEGAEERAAALAGLSRLAQDKHAGVRATALASLGLIGDESQLDVVLAAFSDAFAEVREFAALAAGQIGGDRAIAALQAALNHESAEVRFQAVSALSELDPEHVATDLVRMLQDADAEVRAQAVASISSLEAPHLSGHLASALSDAAPQVRFEAAVALASLGDGRGEEVLLDALSQGECVPEAAEALSRLGCQKAREPLAKIALAWFAAPHLRALTAAALIRLGDPRGLPALRRVLHGLRSDARSYAVELARDLGEISLVEDLTRLASRPRGTDLLTLIDALGTYASTSPAAQTALEKLAARNDPIGQAARETASRVRPVPA